MFFHGLLLSLTILCRFNIRIFKFSTRSSAPIIQTPDDKLNFSFTVINTQCTTPNRKTGICVQYSKCYELQQLVASRDLHKIRFVQASQCGFLFEAYVCCPNLQIQEVGGDEFCLQNDLNKITGGKKTKIGEFRWMAQLQYKINGLKK